MKPPTPQGPNVDRPAPGGIPAPPYVWASEDYAGRTIGITIDYNETTGAITGAVTHRESGCLFSRILIGVGGDGSPENAPHKITCQVGDRNVPAGQLHAAGLDNYTDVINNQITAGI